MSEEPSQTPTEPSGSSEPPLTGGSLLTTPETQPGPEDKPDTKAEPQAKAEPEAAPPETPEGYQFKFDENVQVDKELEGQFRAVAHELKLNPAQAQKLAEMYAGRVADQEKAGKEAYQKAVDGWRASIEARPGFQTEKAQAQRCLAEFGDVELFKVLDETHLGNHPGFFNFMAKVGKALAEPKFRGQGTPPDKKQPLPERMWPNMNKE